MTTFLNYFRAILLVVLLACAAIPALAAPVHEILSGFTLPPFNPGSGKLALGPDGYYWGTTQVGGIYHYGTIYKVKADGSDWKTVLSFTRNGASNKGANPQAGLVSDGSGNFWGTTQDGGASGNGTVFKVNATSGVLTTLVEFTNNGASNKGRLPKAGLVSDGSGFFWGTTYAGGASGYGTVFKVNATSGVLTTLVQFTNDGASNKGANPYAGLVSDANGFFWGTTQNGGANNGTVFKVNATNGALTTLVEF